MALALGHHVFAGVHEDALNKLIKAYRSARPKYFFYACPPLGTGTPGIDFWILPPLPVQQLGLACQDVKAGVHGVPGGESTVILGDGTVRYLTVRESARLQCFRDEYEIVGVRSEAMKQIGNAVPVNVSETLATEIARRCAGFASERLKAFARAT